MEHGLSGGRARLVTIVVVTWNSARTLPRCLDGIGAQTWPEIEVVAVDNASADGSVALLDSFRAQRAEGRAQVLRNSTNAGFSKAVNQAVREANGDFVLLLNPDAYLESDYVEKLIAAFDAAGEVFGAATGRLMRGEGDAIAPTEIVDSLGIRMTRSGRHLDVGQGTRLGQDIRGLREIRTADGSVGGPRSAVRGPFFEVFGVSGAAGMYRMSFVRDVTIDGEFLDEDFFAFREDADVAWRGHLFGWRALYVPDAVAFHVRRVTPERRRDIDALINMHSVKNRFLLRLKNEGAYLALRNAPFEIARDLVALGAVLTVEHTSLPALGWLWRNRSRVLAKRRAIQRRRRVADRALAGWFR